MRLVFELAWIVVITIIACVAGVERKRGGGEKGERFPFPFHFFSPPPPFYGPATRGHLGAFPLPPGWVVSPLVGGGGAFPPPPGGGVRPLVGPPPPPHQQYVASTHLYTCVKRGKSGAKFLV